MARLNLNARGDSFLDLLLVQTKSGAGVEVCLRLPASPGRSVVVLYDKIWWGTDLNAASSFINGIISSQSLKWACTLPDKSGFVSLRWPYGANKAFFSAAWRDSFGTIDYRANVPADNARRFRDSVGVLKLALKR